jgi:hypothetical protein
MEAIAFEEILRYLGTHLQLKGRLARWLYGVLDARLSDIEDMHPHHALRLLAVSDRLACAFARIYYIRIPQAIPKELGAQAAYWKKYYNTTAGAGTVEHYTANYTRLIAPVIGD